VSPPRIGLLLVQLGTPDAPTPRAVRRYLAEFLSDPRVIDMPAPLRRLLLHGVILRTRPRASAAAYQKIWTAEGSPLRFHSEAFASALSRELGDAYSVSLGMRYGQPDVDRALAALASAGTDRLLVWPLFPQHSEAATSSALARVFQRLPRFHFGRVRALGPCYDEPGFIAAWAAVARPALAEARPDHVLMSYHGLPERQIRAADVSGRHCLMSDDCCEGTVGARHGCYRAQCFATSRALAAALALPPGRHSTSFQSRLGRTPWIKPYTDHELPRLFGAGVRRLAVMCPAFVADCLETLEEIGMRAREQWLALGGESLVLVPSLNATPDWVRFAAARVRDAARGLQRESDAAAASPEASASETPTPVT
jgi:ferrochelatase